MLRVATPSRYAYRSGLIGHPRSTLQRPVINPAGLRRGLPLADGDTPFYHKSRVGESPQATGD